MAFLHTKEVVQTDAYPTPFPIMPFSAAVKCNGMVYLSGNIGMDPKTSKLVEGGIKERTVSPNTSSTFLYCTPRHEHKTLAMHNLMITVYQRMIMTIITNVLADSGSHIRNIVKCNVYLTDMKKDFEDMNEAYLAFFPDEKEKPVSALSSNEMGVSGSWVFGELENGR